jgi:DNA-binding transcriptional MocR family regulator
MARTTRPGGTLFANLALVATDGSLFRQIYGRLRTGILDGHLAPGTRLPSTRTLARELSVSRTTAEEVYSQLDAEGFVERRVGDGTYVAAIDVVRTPRTARPAKTAPGMRRLATRTDAKVRHPCFPEAAAGLHVMAQLEDRTGDRAVSERAAKQGVFAEPISRYHVGAITTSGFFLGFAALTPLQIREGVRKLSGAL